MARAAFGATRPAGGAQLGESRLPPVVAPGGHWWNHTGSNAIGRRGLGRATWTDRTIWPRGSQQIGRASCRERVCQYVMTSVVEVSLKNKTKYTTYCGIL